MCGIAGIFCLSEGLISSTAPALAMGAQMERRGPDDEGYVYFRRNDRRPRSLFGVDTCGDARSKSEPAEQFLNGGLDAELIFVHRRLSIVDLTSRGHQPMVSRQGRYALVYNGEIYNYKEIRRTLVSAGFEFESDTDSEVLLYAFQYWGERCVEKMNGMFAFAVWDATDRVLTLCRDRVGIKPLYYTIKDGKLIFASDIKTLIASGVFAPEVNIEGLYHGTSFGICPRPYTMFKDVLSVPPATTIRITDKGEITQNRYWDLPTDESVKLCYDDARDQLEERLQLAVRRRTLADVSVGTFMSGGVDSTMISAMADNAHKGVTAFTLGYKDGGDHEDEVAEAKATAIERSIKHIIDRVNPEEALSRLEEMSLCYEEPYYSLSPNYLISALAAKHNVKVVLNGLGGDELFCGYHWYKWIRYWKIFKHSPEWLLRLAPKGRKWQRVLDVARARSAGRAHTNLLEQISDWEKKNLFANGEIGNESTVEFVSKLYGEDERAYRDDYNRMAFMDFYNYLGNHHVYRVDQFTMHFSLEGRLPFLDHELVEFAMRLPTKYKFKNGAGKILLKDVAKKWIAASNVSATKRGFSLPMESWMRDALKGYVEEHLSMLKQRSDFKQSTIDSYYRMFVSGDMSYAKIWQLVATEKWLQLFIDRPERCLNYKARRYLAYQR